MKVARDVKILRLITVVPPLLVIAFAVMAIVIVVNNNKIQLETELQTLRQDFISSRKSMMKAQVEQLVQQIRYEQSSTESILKTDIKAQVYQGHTIASQIYQNNRHLPEAEVTELIKNALREFRFNNGRGYFFIYKTDGESIMHPIVPSMEGTPQLGLQDIRGNYIVRDMGALAKQQGETYYTWWFVKPENKDKEFKKIGFGKHFAPYDWFIGTGEYLVDVENDIKSILKDKIANIRYGENGHAFLYDYEGNVLVHFADNFQGTNVFENASQMVVDIGTEIIGTAKRGAGFVEYRSQFKPSLSKPELKISYVQGIQQWGWALGMGFYANEIEQQLLDRETEISQQNRSQLVSLLSLSTIVTCFFVLLSLFFVKSLSRRFTAYQDRIDRDFDELDRVKLQMEHQALHDSLTQLPNRTLLQEQLTRGIELSERHGKMLAVMFVDLDDFKKINDMHGHSVGDEYLKQLSVLFQNVVDGGDTVARFGGDEFIFCYPDLESLSQAEIKVQKVLRIFNQAFEVKGKTIFSTGSMGIALYPQDGKEAEELISKADTALYKSKATVKGQALFFNSGIAEQVRRDFSIESELRTALTDNEISVFYQPQVNVKTGCVTGVEALLRWNSQQLGFVSPAEFIPIAENTGAISELGNYVIRQSIQDIKNFNQHRTMPLNLSINISPKQLLEPDFVDDVVHACLDLEFPASLVTLEITENVFISDLSVVQPILEELRQYGFNLSLDDFGTGYSSLSYLSSLPMTEIKIDRAFIDKFLTNSQSESLVKTIIAIGDFCELTVVAEGVETVEQYQRLAEYDCDLVQGYYFDKPLAYTDLLAKYHLSDIQVS